MLSNPILVTLDHGFSQKFWAMILSAKLYLNFGETRIKLSTDQVKCGKRDL